MKSLRVLLVDDNEHMRKIVAAILRAVGVEQLVETGNGEDALKVLETWPADLAIVDFNMAPINGVQFTLRVRNSETSKNQYLPIIMMTGFAEERRVVVARDAGVTEFLVKPVTSQAVVDRLSAVIYKPRPFIRTSDYFGPQRRGIDKIAPQTRMVAGPAPVLQAVEEEDFYEL